MALELITAKLKAGITEGISLYKDQKAELNLSEYLDLKRITGESITYPYTGTPSTQNGGVLAGKTVAQVALGKAHSLVLNSDGTLASWGANASGQLGNYSSIASSIPVDVYSSGTLDSKNITKIKTGFGNCSYALSADGDLLGWGDDAVGASNYPRTNDSGVLDFALALDGNIIVSRKTAGLYHQNQTSDATPYTTAQLGDLSGKIVSQLEGQYLYVFALCSDGTIFRTGVATNLVWTSVPLSGALSGKTVTRLVGGFNRMFAFCSDGTVAGLGSNSYGTLGNGNAIGQTVWAAVSLTGALSGKTITDVAPGYEHTLFLCSDGTIAATGRNANGQLGNGTTLNSTTAVQVFSNGILLDKTPIAIAAGYYHSAAITSDGHIFTWGSDASGQLGNDQQLTNSSLPIPVLKDSFTKYSNHVRFTSSNLPDGLSFDGNLVNTAKLIGSPSTTGTVNTLLKIEFGDFTLYNPVPESGNLYETEGTTYITLPFVVSDPPSDPPPAFSDIIKNSDMQMDVGVSQNIKLEYTSVYQTVYVRVTGLPAGMKYTGSPDGFLKGFISGAPLASGTYNVTIAVSYKTSETSETLNAAKTVVYTVNPVSNPAILLADQNLTSGVSVNLPLLASDASMIVSWNATGLPDGLVCGTGIEAAITGTPSIAGTYNSTVTLVCRKINSSQNTTITKPVTFTIS